MALNDTIATIEAELETLKEAALADPTPEPEVVVPNTPEPQVHQAPATSVAPLDAMIAAQAAERLARSQ
jgi:pyruvate/2-oxoglutarate dehydrogenase complex dihydrolipoamide acyltransferase (E2) component